MSLQITDFEQTTLYPEYIPNPVEEKIVALVLKRFSEMEQARKSLEVDRPDYQTMIDAAIKLYGDDRSSSTVPLASAMIELYVAEALKIPTEFLFKSETTEHSTQAKALEYVWKYDWRKQNRKKEIIANEYTTAGFGYSVMHTGFTVEKYKQWDFDYNDSFELIWEEKNLQCEKIIMKNLDIRTFYLDNQAVEGMDDANDCILTQTMWFEQFKELENNPLYKNIDKVAPQGFDLQNKPFTTPEERNKMGEFVHIKKYWNVAKDMYVELANNKVVIREQHIMSTIDGRKALPFVIRVLGTKTNTYGGRGLCEALRMFNGEINDLRELLMDATRKSNSPTIAIGNDLKFDGRKFAFKNEILTFQGKLNENFQQLTGVPPNAAAFNYLERIYKDIAMFVGIDIQNILGVATQTAYQTNIQVEASQKRVNVRLTNRDLAFERLANLHKDNLQHFFPRKTAEGVYPKIAIEDEEYKEPTQDEAYGKFIPNKGYKGVFEVTPEKLRGDIFIDVFTNINRPTSSIADRQAKLEFSQGLPVIIQGLQAAKSVGIQINDKEYIEGLMEDFNLQDVMKTDYQELQQQSADFISKLNRMMSWSNNMTLPEEMLQEESTPTLSQKEPALSPNPMLPWL